MSDDVVLPGTGSGIRAIEKNAKKAQVVVLDVGGSGAEKLMGESGVVIPVDLMLNIQRLLHTIANPMSVDPSTGAMRCQGTVSVNVNSGQTLATVTSLSQVAGVPAGSTVLDLMQVAWANSMRGRIV